MIGQSPYDRCCRCWNVNRSPLSPGPGEETGRTERHDQASREGNACIAFTETKASRSSLKERSSELCPVFMLTKERGLLSIR